MKWRTAGDSRVRETHAALAPDYKKAEKALEKAAAAAIGVLERSGGEGILVKKPKSGQAA